MILYCINNPYKSLIPAVLSLSLFRVLTVLFYCFWLQVHCTYLSHQNKYALYICRRETRGMYQNNGLADWRLSAEELQIIIFWQFN